MQFPVPKNIDLEDKIIGPMTLRQFLYVLVGGAISYAIFKKLGGPGGNMQLALLISIPIALLTLALAFMKIQEQPLPEFLMALFTFLSRPRQRIWKRNEHEKDLVLEENKEVKDTKVQKKALNTKELGDITKILDQ